MFGIQFSIRHKSPQKLGVGVVLTYQHCGLTKSGCPKHACLKEVLPDKSLRDFPFGKLLIGTKAAKCSFRKIGAKKVPRIEVPAMFLTNKSGWKAPKSITANFCLSCSPELFQVISSSHNRTNNKNASTKWQRKYLLPNASLKLLLPSEIENGLEEEHRRILYSASTAANIQIIC
jgi:hypothetical protein